MEFKAFDGLKFATPDDCQVGKELWRAYDTILTPVFNHIGIGNAKIYLRTNHSKLKCVYGFGKILEGDIGNIYTLNSDDKDETMINLLENEPEKFDEEYAKRVSAKTGKDLGEIIQKAREQRINGSINPESFVDKKKNNLEWSANNTEPIQICDNEELTKELMKKDVIYGDQNSKGVYTLNYWERIDKRFEMHPSIREMYNGDRSRYGFMGSFALYVVDDDKKNQIIGVLEVDELKQIINDSKKPIDKEKLYWAQDIIHKILTTITLASLTNEVNDKFIYSLANSVKTTIDTKDYITSGHCDRVKNLAIKIGQKIIGTEYGTVHGFDEQRLKDLELAALLHDIGKLGVPESILKKDTRLTPQEYLEICKHPKLGDDILFPIEPLKHLIPSIRGHHENWDGSGYPDHLKGEMIPLESRILAVADAYDAITNDRHYRKGLPKEEARKELNEWSGRQFDPNIVRIALEII